VAVHDDSHVTGQRPGAHFRLELLDVALDARHGGAH
jgi:hypothetical protein